MKFALMSHKLKLKVNSKKNNLKSFSQSFSSFSPIEHSLKRIASFCLFAFIFISISNFRFAGTKKDSVKISSETEKQKILIAKVDFDNKLSEIGEGKVEAAFNLAANLSEKYELISITKRDSTIADLKSKNKKPSASNVAKELNADRIYFVYVNKLENMLRVEVSSANLKNGKTKSKGIGYALIKFRLTSDNKLMFDPALLKASQRAMADVEKDSLLFDKCDGSFRVYPAKTMVIGGIDFQEDPKLGHWNLYDKKVITSFDATEVIFETALTAPQYAVYDMASRDSIYAIFNMHIVENYRPPTIYEMQALTKLEVEYYITGLMNRIPEGARLELFFCRIKNNSLDILRSESAILKEDSLDELRILVKTLTKKLLKLEIDK